MKDEKQGISNQSLYNIWITFTGEFYQPT
jgi:hypothetical protein